MLDGHYSSVVESGFANCELGDNWVSLVPLSWLRAPVLANCFRLLDSGVLSFSRDYRGKVFMYDTFG